MDKEKRKREKEGKLKNKNVCFSHPLEIQLPLSKKLLQSAFAQGAYFTSRAESCDLYICFEGETGPRIKSLPQHTKILTPDAFMEFLTEA